MDAVILRDVKFDIGGDRQRVHDIEHHGAGRDLQAHPAAGLARGLQVPRQDLPLRGQRPHRQGAGRTALVGLEDRLRGRARADRRRRHRLFRRRRTSRARDRPDRPPRALRHRFRRRRRGMRRNEAPRPPRRTGGAGAADISRPIFAARFLEPKPFRSSPSPIFASRSRRFEAPARPGETVANDRSRPGDRCLRIQRRG